MYRSPHKRRAIHSPKTWGTNKITWQLHQLIPHLPSLVHQRARFHNGFPCPHLHFRPPFYFLDKLPLLHVGSSSSSPGLLPKARPFPPSLVAGLPAGSLLGLSQGCQGAHPSSTPIPPPGTSLARSWEGCFQFSVISWKEIYEPWTRRFTHPSLTSWGGQQH